MDCIYLLSFEVVIMQLETDIKEMICRQSLNPSFKRVEATSSTDSAQEFISSPWKENSLIRITSCTRISLIHTTVMQMMHWTFTMTTERTGQ